MSIPALAQAGLWQTPRDKFLLANVAVTAGKPRVVTSNANGYLWFPDVFGLSTGELGVSILKSADSFDNATNSYDVYLAGSQSAAFAFGYNTSGFNVGCGSPLVARPNGTVVGGRQLFLIPTPNNGTAVTTFTSDRLTYSAGGATLTSEPNAMSITFPAAVTPYAGSATMFARAFWYGRIVDLGGNVWVTTMQWNPNGSGNTKVTAGCFRSADLGYTWTYIGEIGAPADVPSSTEGFSEPAICRLANGDLFATSRTGSLQPLYSARSTDNGVTWSTPVQSTHPGYAAPSLVTLANGVTVELAGLGNMIFRFTRDNATTWQSWDAGAYHNARAYDDPAGIKNIQLVQGASTGYFGIQEISPNRIAVVYDYLPGGRPGQPGNGTLTAQICLLQFEVTLL
jgi:hypothetical protein